MTAISKLTLALIKKLYPANIQNQVKLLIEEQCGQNLPFCENATPESLHRLRFAALKAGEGNMDKLAKAVNLAKIDWRDLLVWAEFANDLEAHNKWAEQIMKG
ncbi:MAG TPA: hypothetical protein PK078_08605 [Anaerolineales bacterium]|nr:hypothetical protein [Anaerolineales bacterium]HNA87731.1 hypothetical protein [Anaerolineales bacterium]